MYQRSPRCACAEWWQAYSASGNVTGELVYVNYGRIEDYTALNASGVNLTGKIAIARYSACAGVCGVM